MRAQLPLPRLFLIICLLVGGMAVGFDGEELAKHLWITRCLEDTLVSITAVLEYLVLCSKLDRFYLRDSIGLAPYSRLLERLSKIFCAFLCFIKMQGRSLLSHRCLNLKLTLGSPLITINLDWRSKSLEVCSTVTLHIIC